MYKVGDIIAFTDFEDDFLCEINEVYKLDFDKEHQTVIGLNVIYKNTQPVDLKHTIYLPKDDHVIRTKEEYFEIIQNKIDEQQNILKSIKEKYNV